MDLDAERENGKNALTFVKAWKEHAITKAVLQDNEEQQQILIDIICNESVVSIETFFALVEAKGHLRGLRRMNGLVQGKLAEVEEKLKELEQE